MVSVSKSARCRSGPVRNGEPEATASFLNSPKTVSAAALSYVSPTDPIEAESPSSARVSVNLTDVY